MNKNNTFERTDSKNTYFISLVKKLDSHLLIVNGKANSFFKEFNTIEDLQYVIVAYFNEIPIGCGALKVYNSEVLEVKRMYVLSEYRGNKIAENLLLNLEEWAIELNYKYCMLETGIQMKAAVLLYQKMGYSEISKYGQYVNVENSICFKKELNKN